jgi:peptidoglycan hydrolase FlgJ
MEGLKAARLTPPPNPSEVEQKRLRKACEGFEAIFTSYLFKSMRESGFKAEGEDSSGSMGMYEEMMDGTLASELSQNGGLGLAKMLYSQLKSKVTQEK